VALADALREEGHLAVIAVNHKAVLEKPEVRGFEPVMLALVHPEEARELRGVDLFFSPENRGDSIPEGATSVCIFHSLPDAGLTQTGFAASAASLIRTRPKIIKSFDYFVTPVRQSDWKQKHFDFVDQVYPAELLRGRRDVLDIIPGGYPKIDYAERILTGRRATRYILYCPTAVSSQLTKVESDGRAILSALLEEFPEQEVVFRPYPTSADRRVGRELAAEFEAHPRFILDESTTGIAYQRHSSSPASGRTAR
jgi:hypothetical protein